MITSEVIKKDMSKSLERLIQEVGIIEKSKLSIDKIESLITEYKGLNESLLKKANSLEKFGFTNTPTYKNKEVIEGKIKEFNEKIDVLTNEINKKYELDGLIAEYNLEYPSYKFIPKSVMLDVMKKYDLVLSNTCLYGKEIPDYAIEVMEMFKYKVIKKDIFIDVKYRPVFTLNSAEPQEKLLDYISVRDSDSVLGKRESNYVESNLKIIAPQDHFNIPIITSGSRRIPLFKMDDNTREIKINTPALEEEIRNNQKVLDPILALEVDGGYIVLHAWDEEAKIPEIQNVNLN